MYCITDEQIEYIRNDIRHSGIEMEEVNAYNAIALNNKIPTDHSVLTMQPEQLGHITNLFILNSLTQLQINLAMASKEKTMQIGLQENKTENQRIALE